MKPRGGAAGQGGGVSRRAADAGDLCGDGARLSDFLARAGVLSAQGPQAALSRLTQLIPSHIRRPVLQVGLAVQEALTAYARGQMAVSAVTGALTALGLLCIGVPGWLFLGAAMALCNLIPYFGPWLGALPVVLFCGGMGLKKIALGLLIVFAAQQIEGLFVSPLVIGDAARLHPGLVILSLIAGGWQPGCRGCFMRSLRCCRCGRRFPPCCARVCKDDAFGRAFRQIRTKWFEFLRSIVYNRSQHDGEGSKDGSV